MLCSLFAFDFLHFQNKHRLQRGLIGGGCSTRSAGGFLRFAHEESLYVGVEGQEIIYAIGVAEKLQSAPAFPILVGMKMVHHGNEDEVVLPQLGHDMLNHAIVEVGTSVRGGHYKGKYGGVAIGVETLKQPRGLFDDILGLFFNAIVAHVEIAHGGALRVGGLDGERPVEMQMSYPYRHFGGVEAILLSDPLDHLDFVALLVARGEIDMFCHEMNVVAADIY